MTLAFTLFLVGFFVFLGMGIPIAFCLGLASTVYLTLSDAANLTIIFGRMQGVLQSYLYTAIPFFILASALMNTAGITNRIFDFANSLVGHVRGGLAQVNVLASVIFSGMTGTVLGDAAGLGRIEIHAMREAGYRPAFAGAVTISSAVIGPIIPPSMIMIIYAELAEVSIVDLFLGGVIPGLLIGTILMIYIKYSGSPFVIVFKLSCNGLALTTRWATKNYPPRVNIAIITIPFGRVFSWRHCLTAGDSNSVTKRTGI